MPAYSIQDFKSGLDLRKAYVTAPAGSLRVLRNAFISAGAEIEKRTAFILYGPAPAGSIGMLSRQGLPYVVVNGATAAAVPPSGTSPTASVGTIPLPFPAGVTITRVADWDVFNSYFYIVLTDDATPTPHYYHYYAQTRVTDAMATSSSIRTYGGKMYGVDGRLLRFSAINDPTKWTPPTGTTNDGSGYVDLSVQDTDSTQLVGLEAYYADLAVFSTLSTQLWTVNADPSQNSFKQLLRATGTIATNGLTQFGSGDVLYLSSHGVRSLRAQNITLTAGVTDIGTPIDEIFRQLIIQNGPAWFAHARCMIQPRSGRVLVVLPDRIFVLTTFQEPAVTAWSTFDAPFSFVDSCVSDPWVMLRGSDGNIYQYGSDVSSVYDATEAEVITPALSCDSPGKTKIFHSFDIGAEGTWTLSAGCDPNNQATEEAIATFTGATYANTEMTMPEVSTHISLRFRTTDPTRARLGHVVLFFDDGSQD